MKITDVRIKLVSGESRLRAIATITFNDSFVVHDIRVIEGEKGLFVAMPSKKMANGEFRDIAHPIHAEMRKEIEDAVKDSYEKALTEQPAE
ncbi:septation regulator SpoVG [Acholeplasma sp. OttesenSCG-928-E16]|nr:septation regulator SpoVG [Acholeplasma sp. OttesenSCG-928-E16]